MGRLLSAVERFRVEMAALGITVTGFEVATDRDERALAAFVPQAMVMPIGLSADRPPTSINGATVTVRRRH